MLSVTETDLEGLSWSMLNMHPPNLIDINLTISFDTLKSTNNACTVDHRLRRNIRRMCRSLLRLSAGPAFRAIHLEFRVSVTCMGEKVHASWFYESVAQFQTVVRRCMEDSLIVCHIEPATEKFLAPTTNSASVRQWAIMRREQLTAAEASLAARFQVAEAGGSHAMAQLRDEMQSDTDDS